MTAHYIAFEGAEGCGKSTQAKRLATRIGAVLTQETGGTDIGARLDETVVKRVLLRRLTIRASRRAGQDTARARGPLLRITRKLLGGSDNDVARTALAALEKRYGPERSR